MKNLLLTWVNNENSLFLWNSFSNLHIPLTDYTLLRVLLVTYKYSTYLVDLVGPIPLSTTIDLGMSVGAWALYTYKYTTWSSILRNSSNPYVFVNQVNIVKPKIPLGKTKKIGTTGEQANWFWYIRNSLVRVHMDRESFWIRREICHHYFAWPFSLPPLIRTILVPQYLDPVTHERIG